MVSCNRCGLCCYYLDKDGKTKKCKHLIILNKFKTLCRIFNKRNARLRSKEMVVTDTWKDENDNDKHIVCIERKFSKYDYPSCPYNSGKELPPWFK